MKETKWPFSYIYSSFNFDSLKKIHTFDSKAEVNYLTKNLLTLKSHYKGSSTDFISVIHPRRTYAFKHPLLLKSSKRPLRLWTVNQETEIRQAFQQHVAGIITDFPERALEIRREIQDQSK